MNFYKKYLKYKQKYLELKGAGPSNNNPFLELQNSTLSDQNFKNQFLFLRHLKKKIKKSILYNK
jgi:hypothetical protein